MSGAMTRRLGATLLAVVFLAGPDGPTPPRQGAERRCGPGQRDRVAQAFEKERRQKVSLAFGTVGVTRQRLATEAADVVIMSDVASTSRSAEPPCAGSRTDIARTGMGVGRT